MATCDQLMCAEGLSNKKEARIWLLKHHPDKGGQSKAGLVGDVTKCMNDKKFCHAKTVKAVKTVNTKSKATSRKNVSSSINRVFKRVHHASLSRGSAPEEKVVAYKPNSRQLDCIRQVSNWSKITRNNRFNKAQFDNKATDKLIPIASPKLEAMLQNIAALDANDMALHGKKFKHFIFSDIKTLGYGAKIISAAFIARGISPVLKFVKSRIVVDIPAGPGDNFAVLSSTALWDSPFKHKLKKEVLDMFNKRPDNVYGENCRFIILDSGFKEGIDLFDVRYVHLFEPLMTEADMTQALGRATRLCGQKGLDFIPNKGWPLHVYKYSQSIPEQLQSQFKAQTLFEIALQLKGLDSRLHNISKAIKDVSILAAVDQPLTETIHKSGLMPRLVVKTSNKSSLGVASIDITRTSVDMTSALVKENSRLLKNKGLSPLLELKDGEATSLFSFSDRSRMLALEDKESSRSSINTLEVLADSETRHSSDVDPCKYCLSAAIVPFAPSRLSSRVVVPTVVMESNVMVVVPPSGPSSSFVASSKPPKSWFELRRYILHKYGKMAWPVQEIVNKCIDKKGAAVPVPLKKDEKDYIVEPKRKVLPQLKLVDYTPTQDFISSYFTADSHIKGMLLWHSVGTGKTCSAIALASTQFEPEGYSIIWVTRHTLKADIWKNIFDQVCHKTIADEVRAGKLAPEETEKRQKRLQQQWIPPMSYRQFSNVVQGKNVVYDLLKKRNGKADPLKRTLIIIDEAHKLYSSDFKGAEKPDVPAFMAALQNSYAVSGQDSARVLLMTATPYNESPMELMSLLNLCRVKEDHLPTEMGAFVNKYMDSTGNFTKPGLSSYMNAIAGQISYLNREADPSQFAQPVFAEVVVPISTYDSVKPGDNDEILNIKRDMAGLLEEKRALEEGVIPHLQTQINLFGPAQTEKLAECETIHKGKPKDLKQCLARVTKKYKDGLKLEERNLRDAVKRIEKIDKEFIKLQKNTAAVTKKLKKNGLSSLTQQAQLETRCKIGV
jgi:superfamily II DNA or RNA helicase